MMKVITSTDAKNNFGKYMAAALAEPIAVSRSGQDAIVMISKEEYERLKAIEDAYWVLRTKMAEKSGYLRTEEGEKIIKKLLNV